MMIYYDPLNWPFPKSKPNTIASLFKSIDINSCIKKKGEKNMTNFNRGIASPYKGQSKIIEWFFKSVDIGDCIKKKESKNLSDQSIRTDKRV